MASRSGCRLHIGGLSNVTREKDVERFFTGYGRVMDIMMKTGYCFVDLDDSRDADDAAYDLSGKELCGRRVTVEIARGTPKTRADFIAESGRGDGYGGGFDRGGEGRSYERRGGGGGGYNGRDYYDRPSRGGARGGARGGGSYGYGGGRYDAPYRTKFRVIVENLSTKASWQDLKDYVRQAGEVTYADAHRIRQHEGCVDFATEEDMQKAIEKLDGTEVCGRNIRMIVDDSHMRKQRSRSAQSGSPQHDRSDSASPPAQKRGRLSGSPPQRREGSRSPHARKRSRSPSPRQQSASPAL